MSIDLGARQSEKVKVSWLARIDKKIINFVELKQAERAPKVNYQ